MLILTRHIGESIMIGDDIEVRILRVIDYEIRLGITAPRQIAVHREEIYRRITRERSAERGYLRTK